MGDTGSKGNQVLCFSYIYIYIYVLTQQHSFILHTSVGELLDVRVISAVITSLLYIKAGDEPQLNLVSMILSVLEKQSNQLMRKGSKEND